MKAIIIMLLSALVLCSCGNSYQKNKVKRDNYINLISLYKALNQCPETAKVEYNDSIHKYALLLNNLK